MANSLVRLFTFQNAMDLGLQPEMGLDHASFQITWWSLFSLACIPGIEKVVGWIWTAMDSEPRRWSVLWAQGTASYMSCKHCNYCTFSNNSPLPWLFRAVTELNLASMTTVTAIEGHLKTEAWSPKWSLKPLGLWIQIRMLITLEVFFVGFVSPDCHRRKHILTTESTK